MPAVPAPLTFSAPDRCRHGFDIADTCPEDSFKHAPEHFALHVALYTLADKYLMPPLQELCVEKLKECAHLHSRTEEFAHAIELI